MVHTSIQRKISLLQDYSEKLKPYTNLATSVLIGNEEKLAAMERWFLLLVDEAVDINAALAYQLGKKIPESNKSTFYELVPLGIIDGPFATRISESVKIRNQLAHDYEKLQKSVAVKEIKKFYALYEAYALILVKKFLSTTEK